MRLRTIVMTVAVLLAAAGVAAISDLGQAQAAWDLAGYIWAD
jgi:threonine/homoserine efflux transporter RhtA